MKTLLTGRCLVNENDVYRIGIDYEGDLEIEIENDDEEEYMSVYLEEDKAVELANAILANYGKKEAEVKLVNGFIETFKLGGIAINCPTEEEAKAFLTYLEKNSNLKWASGHLPTAYNHYWSVYEEETCFEIRDGHLLYCETSFFEKEGFDIFEYKELEL